VENYDEVGNEPHRISAVAGMGRGFRRKKVAAAATLLSRGIPRWFMGAEPVEWRQFAKDGCDQVPHRVVRSFAVMPCGNRSRRSR